MISSETPYKLKEIIIDTWPQIYRKPISNFNNKTYKLYNVTNKKTSTN